MDPTIKQDHLMKPNHFDALSKIAHKRGLEPKEQEEKPGLFHARVVRNLTSKIEKMKNKSQIKEDLLNTARETLASARQKFEYVGLVHKILAKICIKTKKYTELKTVLDAARQAEEKAWKAWEKPYKELKSLQKDLIQAEKYAPLIPKETQTKKLELTLGNSAITASIPNLTAGKQKQKPEATHISPSLPTPSQEPMAPSLDQAPIEPPSSIGVRLEKTTRSSVVPVQELDKAAIPTYPALPSEIRTFIDRAKKDILSIPNDELEKGLDAALQMGENIKNPEDKTTLLSVSERVAQSYIQTDFQKTLAIRMETAKKIGPSSPFSDFHLKLSKAHPKFGLRLQPLDTSLFKNHTLTVQKRTYTDGIHQTTKLRVNTKLSHPARNQIQRSIEQLKNNPNHQEALLSVLPAGFCKGVKVTEELSGYYRKLDSSQNMEGDFSSDQNQGIGFKTNLVQVRDEKGKLQPIQIPFLSHVIEFEGVGKVIIGNNPSLVSEFNQLSIELDSNITDEEAASKLHIIFAALGLSTVSSTARSEDIERIKILQLFRGYYPKEAFGFEKEAQTFEESIESLQKRILEKVPQMKLEFERFADQPDLMYQQEVYPGQYVWSIKGLADEARDVGALVLMSGVGTLSDTFDVAVKRIISMVETGPMSTQDRLHAGMIINGFSSDSDLISGGAESVFTRMVTKSMSKNLKAYPLAGKIQILYDLDIVERVGFAYSHDEFGTKDPKTYSYRPNIVELTESASKLNEVCIRNHISPKFIKGVIVANDDEKKKLIDAFRAGNLLEGQPGSESIHGISINKFIHVGQLKPEYLSPAASPQTKKTQRQFLLKDLNLQGKTITDTQVQELIRNYPNIQSLNLRNATLTDGQLQVLIKNFPKLRDLNLSGCNGISNAALENLPNHVEKLNLSGCSQFTDEALRNLPKNMRDLNLSGCSQLTDEATTHLPENISVLYLSGCHQLKSPNLKGLVKLRELYLTGCTQLTDAVLGNLPRNLEVLDLRGCTQLTDAAFDNLTENNISYLNLSGCNQLKSPNFQHFGQLGNLKLSGCLQLTDVRNLRESISYIDLSGCNQLKRANFKDLVKLYELNLTDCSQLADEALKNLPNSLQDLNLTGCNSLTTAVLKPLTVIRSLKLSDRLEKALADVKIEAQKKFGAIRAAKIKSLNEYPFNKRDELIRQCREINPYFSGKIGADSQLQLAVDGDIVVGFYHAEKSEGKFQQRNFALQENLNKNLGKDIEKNLIIKAIEEAKINKIELEITTWSQGDVEEVIEFYKNIARLKPHIKLTESHRTTSDGDNVCTFIFS